MSHKKLSLCIDTRFQEASGIGTYIRNLLPQFQALEEFEILTLDSKTPYAMYSWKEMAFLPFHVPQVDFFWSPHFNVPLLPLRAKKRIVTIHDLFHLSPYCCLKWHEKTYAKLLLHQAVHRSDLIFTDSFFSKSELLHHFHVREDKICVSPLSGNPLTLSKEPNSILPEQFILFVGNIKPHKNLETLLEAYRLWIEKKGKQVHLVIVGKEFASYPLKEKVLKNTSLAHQVHWMHDVGEELGWIYKKASVTILPSFYEGFGLPPLEAMHFQCPVILSDIPPLKEVCQDAALYFSPYDPNDLYLALERVLENPSKRTDLQRKGSAHVAQFSWASTFARHLEGFKSLL